MKKFSFSFFISILILFLLSCSDDTYQLIITGPSDPDTISIENVVIANSSENYPEISSPVNKDYLVLFYLAADNTQNDNYFLQMAEIGKGLKTVKRYDGVNFKSDYKNITAVGLWDGFNTDGSFTPNYYLPNSYLFEFKYPLQSSTSEIVMSYKNFTTDCSDEVMSSENNWLSDIQEVNMASSDTLKNFLSWAIAKYNSDNSKEIILVISGNGGGSFGVETGTYIPPSSRATCRDYSSESFFLSASQIKSALEANGFNSANKLKLLIIDSGYSASLEDAFELRNNVTSMIASPSDVPAGAINFNYLIQTLRKGSSIYSIGTELVNIYANCNYMYQQNSDKGMASLSFIDLSQIENLGNNVNMLAHNILETKDTKNEDLLIDRKYTVFDSMKNSQYGFLLYNDEKPNYITDAAMFYKPAYYHKIPKHDFFFGYFYQNDLGYMAHAIARAAEKNGIDTIYYYCNEIKTNLKSILISKWRNGNSIKQGLYPFLIKETAKEDSAIYYGLTLTGQARIQSLEYLQPYNFSNFEYKTYKYNGKSNWGDLLKALFPDQFKDCTFYEY